jgi:biotin carboxylase
MAMNVLFISCHYPTTTSPLYCERLAKAGANVLGIGDVPSGSLPAHLRDCLRAYRQVPNMNDREAMVAAGRELRDRFGTIDRVDSNIEHWLTTEAAIRADQHIAGMQPEYLTHARSKIGMKELFAAAGVPLMAGINTTDKERVREFAQFHGFPLFFKPDTGVGSLGVFRCDSMEDLDARLPTLPDNYLCEPYIKGRILTFDGLADKNSEVFYCTSHTYRAGVADMIEDMGDTHVYSFRELPPGLEALGRRAVKSFGVQERFFHIEFFETAPGEYLALEMNLRAPGSTVLHLMNYAADLDIFDAWARLLARGENKLAYSRKYHAAHVGRRDALRYAHGHIAVLDRLGPALVHHARLPEEDRAGLGDECYIIRHENFDELKALIAYIEAKA